MDGNSERNITVNNDVDRSQPEQTSNDRMDSIVFSSFDNGKSIVPMHSTPLYIFRFLLPSQYEYFLLENIIVGQQIEQHDVFAYLYSQSCWS